MRWTGPVNLGVWSFILAAAFTALVFVNWARAEQVVVEGNAWTDEKSAIFSFRTDGVEDCHIGLDLRVQGDRRARCVERLELAARLGRAEMRVNEQRKKAVRR